MKRENEENNDPQRHLHTGLMTSYSFEELKTVCFGLGLDFDNLPGDGKEAKARELLLYLKRRNMLPALIEYCSHDRPSFPWEQGEIRRVQSTSKVLSASPARTSNRIQSPRQTKSTRIETALVTKIERGAKTWSTLFVVWLIVQAIALLICVIVFRRVEELTLLLVAFSPAFVAFGVTKYVAFRLRHTDGFNYLTKAERSKIILLLKHHFDGDSWSEWFTQVCISAFLDYDKRKQRP